MCQSDGRVWGRDAAHTGPSDPEEECRAEFVTGPAHDPYGTDCELEPQHEGPHDGPDPFGGTGRVQWRGGEMAGGDRLPYLDVRWIG